MARQSMDVAAGSGAGRLLGTAGGGGQGPARAEQETRPRAATLGHARAGGDPCSCLSGPVRKAAEPEGAPEAALVIGPDRPQGRRREVTVGAMVC
jgi:hypothetical protein